MYGCCLCLCVQQLHTHTHVFMHKRTHTHMHTNTCTHTLQGGGWDFEAGCLTEPEPMELIVPMPILLFK